MVKRKIEKIKMTSDSQLHLSTTYPRKRGKEKSKPKRVFNFVLTGLLISSTLMGSVFTGQEDVFATNGVSYDAPTVTQTAQVNPYQDELAMVSNLKMATKVLTQAIERGELTPAMYQKVLSSLTTIEAKLDSGSEFSNLADLTPVLYDTGVALIQDSDSLSMEGYSYRDAGADALIGVYTKLGLEVPSFEVVEVASATDVLGVTITNRVYKDLNLKYVSHKNIKWAADRGYLNVYLNTTHPAKKMAGKGNWVDYSSKIRERDMLATVFRYARSSEYSKLKVTNKKNSHSKEYQLAAKYGLKTRATVTNTTKSSQAVTRIEFARALSYAHYGKKVTDAQAIKFMYTAKVTNGNKVGTKYPKTTASFGSNVAVTRADVALGIKAYDTYKVALDKASASKPVTPPSTGTQVGAIKTQYGSHTYGVNNQAEYDAVMKIVKEEFAKNFNKAEWGLSSYQQRVLKGEKPITDRNDPNFRSEDNIGLIYAENGLKPYFDGEMTLDSYVKLSRADSLYRYIIGKYGIQSVEGDKNVKSAYNALIQKKLDCDAGEQLRSAIYDMAGIDNVVVGDGVTHAVIMFKLDGKWMDMGLKAFTKSDVDSVNKANVYLSYTQGGSKIAY